MLTNEKYHRKRTILFPLTDDFRKNNFLGLLKMNKAENVCFVEKIYLLNLLKILILLIFLNKFASSKFITKKHILVMLNKRNKKYIYKL